MSKRDYYQILEVSITATFTEIKSAYRKQARRYHPDLNPHDPQAEIRFKEVNEAYEVLSDADKRSAYDRYGHDAFAQGGGRGPAGFEDFFGGGLGDIFEQMFGAQNARDSARARKGDDLRIDVRITLKEAFLGVTKTAEIHSPVSCGTCHGTGSRSDRAPVTCSGCRGRGVVRRQNGFFVTEHPCPQCEGTGAVVTDPCPQCHGHGIFQGTRNLDIQIPAGIDDNSRMVLRGQGNPGLHNLPAGDLHVYVSVARDKHFERENGDLHTSLEISMTLAALGGTAELKNLDDEKIEIHIAAGAQTGEIVNVRNKGFSILNSNARGKLHVHLKVQTPKSLTAKQKELLRAFEEEEIRKDQSLLGRTSSFLGKTPPQRKK